MFDQRFGVEVEMNAITRRRASKLASIFFGTGDYDVVDLQHNGSVWAAWDSLGREWKFAKDASILGDDTHKVELITPVLTYKNDIETLQELCRTLRKAGAKSDASRNCGVHVHVESCGQTATSLRNLTNIIATHEKLLIKALDIDPSRLHHYCKPTDKLFLKELNADKPLSLDNFKDIWYKTQCDPLQSRTEKYNSSRYHMLNLHSTFIMNTIEFRMFQFDKPDNVKLNGIHAGQLKAFIQLCLAICNKAKHLKYTKCNTECEISKDAMIKWLTYLGMKGHEFDTARTILTKRL